MADQASIRLRLDSPPTVRTVASCRRFVEELYVPLLGPDVGAQIALTVHELLENVSKYAVSGPVLLDVEMAPMGAKSYVRVTTASRAPRERLEELERVLCAVNRPGVPLATYLNLMAESADREAGSGLGLARIRAEADMEIRYAIVGDEVTITAEAWVPRPS